MESAGSDDPAERFTGLAEAYAAHRPSYPAEAIDFVVAHCGLRPRAAAADVGCGTGISTRLFAQRGLSVVGVEPNDEMRRRAEETPCPAGAVEPVYRAGRGESTGLDDRSMDAVICAQAFHWLRPREALAEFHRILKPGGWTALIWNERDESDAFTRLFGDVIRTAPDARLQESRRAAAGRALFESNLFRDCERRAFPSFQTVDLPGLLGRAFSASYAPKDVDGREAWRASLRRLFETRPEKGRVRIVYETSVYVGRRA
jgi:SAM-dependent methyltransferase